MTTRTPTISEQIEDAKRDRRIEHDEDRKVLKAKHAEEWRQLEDRQAGELQAIEKGMHERYAAVINAHAKR